MLRQFFLGIGLLLSPALIYTQSAPLLEGVCKLSGGEWATGATVQLTKLGSNNVLAYAIVNEKGYWSIPEPKSKDTFSLKIAFLGYIPYRQVLRPGAQFIICELQPENSQLPQAEVQAQRYGMTVKEDTLYYDLSKYTDSTEVVLKDILQKLPLISVEDDGSVTFKGKRVNKMLVERRDIFGSLHRHMVEGVKASDIESIQVMENYRESTADAKGSGDVAVNVKLKKSALGKISGPIHASAGHRPTYDAGGTLYCLGNTLNGTCIFGANNAVREMLSNKDVMAIIDRDNMPTDKMLYYTKDLLPIDVNPASDLSGNNDGFSAIRLLLDPTSQTKTTTTILGNIANADRQNTFARLFTGQSNSPIFAGDKESRNHRDFLSVQNKWKHLSKNKAFQLVADLRFHATNDEWNERVIGTWNNENLRSTALRQNSRYLLNPHLYATQKLDDLLSLRLDVILTQSRATGSTQNNTNFPDFFSISQTQELQQTRLDYLLSFNVEKAQDKYSFVLGYAHTDWQNDWRSADIGNGLTHIREQATSYRFKYNRYKGKIRGNAILGMQHLARRADNPWTNNVWLPEFSGSISMDIGRPIRALGLSTSIKQSNPDLTNLANGFMLYDAQTLYSEQVSPFVVGNQRNVGLTYFERIPKKEMTILASFNSNLSNNTISYVLETQQDLWIRRAVFAPETENHTTHIYLSWSRKEKRISNISSNTHFGLLNTLLPSGQRISNTTLSLDNSMSIVLKPKLLKLTLGFDANYSQQRTTGSVGRNVELWSLRPQLGTKLTHRKIIFEAEYSTTFQLFGNGGSNRFDILDAKLEWKPFRKPLSFIVTGNNLLNWDNMLMLATTPQANFIDFEQRIRIGARLTVGLKWLL